jgi:hypothetical protein
VLLLTGRHSSPSVVVRPDTEPLLGRRLSAGVGFAF